MTLRSCAPGLWLALAAALGGLRFPLPWIIFGALFISWFLRSGRSLVVTGREAGLLFFCWVGAAALFSSDPAFSLSILARYAVFAAVFFSAERGEEEGWVSCVLGLGLAASAAFIFQRALGLGPTGFIGANPNYSAAFAAAAFPAALLLALEGVPGARKNALLAAAAVLAAGLAASGSRGAMGVAFLSAAAGLGYTRRWGWLAGLSGAVLALAAFLPASALADLFKLGDPRAFSRPRLWGAALEAAAASPMLGWGPGLFDRVFELFKFPYFDGVSFYGHNTLHAHSEFFNLAAEAGFPAALLFLAAGVLGIFQGGGKSLPLKLCGLSVFLQCSVDIIFYSGAVSLLFWGSIGVLSAGVPAAASGGGKLNKLLAAACMAGLISGVVLSVLPAPKKARGPYPEAGVARFRLEAIKSPKNPLPEALAGDILFDAGNLKEAEAAYKRALALEPFFAGAWLDLARIYAATGRLEAACAELSLAEKASSLKPKSDYGRILVRLEPEEFEGLKKELCRKKRTGPATARSPRTR
jgi:O-antigen ligase